MPPLPPLPPKRILIVQAGLGAGGAEKVVSALAAHWSARHAVRVMGLNAPDAESYFPYPPDVSVVAGTRSRGARGRPADVWRLRRAARSWRADVVVSFLTKVNVMTAAALAGSGVPLVTSERNNPQAQAGPVLQRVAGWAAGRATICVMQTRAARDALPARVRGRAVVIANPCAPYAGAVTPGSHVTAPHFTAVGRLDRQKGFDLLLDAFAMLDRPDARLVIHGEGPERGALEAQVARLELGDRVSLPGRTAAPGGWLAGGGTFVLSSRFEGYPNALMEAMAAGLPVAAFDCPWGPADMIRDGGNGLLVPPGDVAALAAAMRRLLDDPALAARLGTAAAADAERWAPERIFAAWDDVLARAIPA